MGGINNEEGHAQWDKGAINILTLDGKLRALDTEAILHLFKTINWRGLDYIHTRSAYFNEETRKWTVYDNQLHKDSWGSNDQNDVWTFLFDSNNFVRVFLPQ